MLLLLPILVPLIGGIFVFRQKNETYRDWLVVTLIVITAVMVLANCTMPTQRLWLLTIQGDLGLVLNSDWLSKFFMVLAVCIWAPVVVFTKPYIRHAGQGNQFMGFYTMTLGVLMGLAQAANFVTMYMFFEMMSLITVPLVLHNATPAARRAGFKYLGYSVFGAGMALAGYFFIAYYLTVPGFSAGWGHRFLPGCRAPAAAAGGILSDDRWLRGQGGHDAHAVLAACRPSGGAGPSLSRALRCHYQGWRGGCDPGYLLYVWTGVSGGSWPQYVLLTLTLATVFVGSMLAYREKQLKRRLAYSTVSQVSYVLFGLMLLTPDGVQASLLQMVFHALAKDTLFLAAGAIIFSTNCTRVDQLRGIGRRMPVTMWCFTLAALSLIGIPPMAGFVSKWYLLTASLEAPIQAFGVAGLVVLVVSALLTAGYLLPVVTEGFFPGRDFITERREVGVQMTWPMIAFAAAVVLIGLLPGGLLHWLGLLAARLFP